jgi:hypothetical protein
VLFIHSAGFCVNSQHRPCLYRDGVGQPEPRRIRTATGAEAKIEATAANPDQP